MGDDVLRINEHVDIPGPGDKEEIARVVRNEQRQSIIQKSI